MGAILVRPEILDRVASLIKPSDFYREAHGRIFQAMLDLSEKGNPVDLVTVTALLKERGYLESLGGPVMTGEVFLAGLSEQVGFATNAEYYAGLVWKISQVRKVRTKAQQILNQKPNGNLEEYLTWVESQIFEVTKPALHRISGDCFPPLDSTLTPISEWLKNPPPPRDYLFKEVLPARVVGGVVAIGGTGKGHLIIRLGLSLATGREDGPLKSARKFRILYLSGEDSQEELQRRVSAAAQMLWPDGSPPPEIDNFVPVSVIGKLGPLMRLDDARNPVNAPAYEWVCQSLGNLLDIDVLILDPKSKFYGLDENDNSHCAAWINCLESIVSRFKTTTLFCHHESKAKAGSMDKASSRGGSALTDGCRWVANIRTMEAKTAEKFQVADPHNYVVMDVSKNNYSPKLPGPVYFRRGAGGALAYVDLAAERVQELARRLVGLLAAEEEPFSRNDLIYEKKGRVIAEELKGAIQGFNRIKDINQAVDHAIEAGWLSETPQKGKKGRAKSILLVTEMGRI